MGFPNPIVEIAFNNSADETLYATQGWTDVTPWVKSMSGPLRGREYEVDRSEAGTLSVTLDNTDGEFTPGNATSPFYPNIKSNRRFRVRGKNMVAPNIARGGGADHSALFFERPTWSDDVAFSDAFDRVETGGWGGTWQFSGGLGAQYSVTGSAGRHAVEVVNSSRRTRLPVSLVDVEVLMAVSSDVLAVGGNLECSPMLRIDPADVGGTYYYAEVEFSPTQKVRARLVRRQASVDIPLSTAFDIPGLVHAAGRIFWIRAQIVGKTIRMRVWQDGTTEPTAWTVTVTDGVSAILTPGQVGVRSLLDPGNTNTLPVNFSIHEFSYTTSDYTVGVSEPVWKQHDPATYPALPAELTDHIEVTVAAGTYSGFRRVGSWVVPLEIGSRLTHSAYIWKVSGTEPAGEGRFEIFYFDNDDVDIIAASVGSYGLNRPMERYTTGTPTTPTRKQFSHAPVGTAKYARVNWAINYGENTVISAPITYAITGIQSELPANLAPNPNGDWDQLHWHGRGTNDIPVVRYSANNSQWLGLQWTDSAASLYQTIPHLIPGETYAVTADVNLLAGHPAVILTGDGGGTGPMTFRFNDSADNFNGRTSSSSWGLTSGGFFGEGINIPYTLVGGATSDYAVASNVATHSHNSINVRRTSRIGLTAAPDWDVSTDFKVPATPTGAPVEISHDFFQDATNEYGVQCAVNTDSSLTVSFYKNLGGTLTFSGGTVVMVPGSIVPGTFYRFRVQKVGSFFRASITSIFTSVPTWLWTYTDGILPLAGPFIPGLRTKLQTGNTNTQPYVFSFDAYTVMKLDWQTLRTSFVAGGPEEDIELLVPEGQGSPTDQEILVRGLNVQRVADSSVLLSPEVANPSGATAYERPKDIFEGWVERWPWKVDSDETAITAVDRLKRVGSIDLANVVSETLMQDQPAMVIPMNDDPTVNDGTVTWYGSWAQETTSASLRVDSTKGDVLNASYTLGEEGPTEEPAILWTPASTNPDIGYYIPIPYSPDYATPPPVVTEPPPSAPPPTATKTYTKTYYAIWSRSYDSDGTTRWDDSAYMYQGCYECSQNQRSLVGFNWSAIKADLTGANIASMYFTVKNAHARWNRGLTLALGTHSYGTKPSTWSGTNVSESVWKISFDEFQKRSIGIPLATAAYFKSGTLKGFAIGPAPSNMSDNYGYFYGATQSNKPYITITYKK